MSLGNLSSVKIVNTLGKEKPPRRAARWETGDLLADRVADSTAINGVEFQDAENPLGLYTALIG